MGFAVALDLGGFDERLEPGSHRRQFPGERLAVEGLHREHAAVAQVAVVGDRQHLATGLLLELGQVLPEVFRILAVELRERQGAVRDARIAAEEHVAVQVVAADGGPLETDDRGEAAGLVVLVGQRRVGLPGIAHGLVALDGRLLAGQRGDDLHRRREDRVLVAGGQGVVPLPAVLRGQDLGIAAQQLRHQPVHLGVVGDHEEIERP